MALVLALIHVVVAAPPANASVNNLRFGTWNMQGADGGRKWTEMVPGLFRTPGTFNDRNAVMALQEIGSAPSGTSVSTQAIRADYTNRLTNTVVHNTVDVNENLIEIGGEFYSLFWAITDSNGAAGVPGRVNVGIMVRNSRLNGQTPQPVVIQPDTTSNGSLPRPMIGVRIGADVYYSIHAWSGAGTTGTWQSPRSTTTPVTERGRAGSGRSPATSTSTSKRAPGFPSTGTFAAATRSRTRASG